MNVGIWESFPKGYIPEWLEGSAWGNSPTNLYPHEGFFNADFESIIQKLESFSVENRAKLCAVIENQSSSYLSEIQLNALQDLKSLDTFTVVTGQQIHIGLGPLYVIFKIATAIQLAKHLSAHFPNNKFVPVFWMATEDHDFQEISKIQMFGKTWNWNSPDSPVPVGNLDCEGVISGLEWVEDFFSNHSSQANAKIQFLKQLAHQHHHSFADFTAHYVCHLFEDFPLLVLNPNDAELKIMASTLFEKDLFSNELYSAFQSQEEDMKEYGLTPAAFYRECNLFSMSHNYRERIQKNENGTFEGVETGWVKSGDEMRNWVKQNPKDISPNVLLRPLYQQMILPNIAYVAGASEYQYWLQTTKAFEQMNLVAPALIHRKGGMLLSPGNIKKINRFGVNAWEMFALSEKEIQMHVLKLVDQNFSLHPQLEVIGKTFEEVFKKLYDWKSEHLKQLKKTAELFEKEAKKAAKDAQEKALEKHFSEVEWNSFMELKQQIFQANHPMERSFLWLQLYLQQDHYKEILQLLVEMTEFDQEKFWLIQA